MTRPKFNRCKLLLIVLGVLVVLALAGYWIPRSIATAIFLSDSATPTAAEYAAWVKLEIPATVQNGRSYGEGWQDWYIQARFELPLEELPKFLNDNKLVKINFTQPPQNVYKQSWFDPKPPLEVYELKSSDTQQGRTVSGFYPTVYLEHKGSTIIVYIVAFTT